MGIAIRRSGRLNHFTPRARSRDEGQKKIIAAVIKH